MEDNYFLMILSPLKNKSKTPVLDHKAVIPILWGNEQVYPIRIIQKAL